MRVLRFRRKLKLICYRFIFYPFFLLFLVVLIVLLGLLLTTSYYENWFNLYLFDYGTDETFTSENILDTLPPFLHPLYTFYLDKFPTKIDLEQKGEISVHIVPFSHTDPGWRFDTEDYFKISVRGILNTVVDALTDEKG